MTRWRPNFATGEALQRKVVFVLNAHAQFFQLRGGKEVLGSRKLF
jgi:hypothetical protein